MKGDKNIDERKSRESDNETGGRTMRVSGERGTKTQLWNHLECGKKRRERKKINAVFDC